METITGKLSVVIADDHNLFINGLWMLLNDEPDIEVIYTAANGRELLSMLIKIQPQLLLLDEPSLGLAPLIVRRIFQIIREINAEGTTIFLVEQNAHMALTVANRGYVLQSGRVMKTGKAGDLLQDPDVKAAYLGG